MTMSRVTFEFSSWRINCNHSTPLSLRRWKSTVLIACERQRLKLSHWLWLFGTPFFIWRSYVTCVRPGPCVLAASCDSITHDLGRWFKTISVCCSFGSFDYILPFDWAWSMSREISFSRQRVTEYRSWHWVFDVLKLYLHIGSVPPPIHRCAIRWKFESVSAARQIDPCNTSHKMSRQRSWIGPRSFSHRIDFYT